MAEFVLHVSDIDELGKDFSFVLSQAWLDASLQDATLRANPTEGPGALRVHVQHNAGGEYLVTGTLRAELLTECGRCLGDARVPVDVEVAALFTRAVGHTGHTGHAGRSPARHKAEVIEVTDEDDDLQRETFSGNDILLDDLVREHLVLEVPMQPLCSEQCQGIAVPQHLRPPPNTFQDTSGSAGAVDPRLAPLQRLRDNVPPSPAASQPDRAQHTPAKTKNKLPNPSGSKTEKE